MAPLAPLATPMYGYIFVIFKKMSCSNELSNIQKLVLYDASINKYPRVNIYRSKHNK